MPHIATTSAIESVQQGAPDNAANPALLAARLAAELVSQTTKIRTLLANSSSSSGPKLVTVADDAEFAALTSADVNVGDFVYIAFSGVVGAPNALLQYHSFGESLPNNYSGYSQVSLNYPMVWLNAFLRSSSTEEARNAIGIDYPPAPEDPLTQSTDSSSGALVTVSRLVGTGINIFMSPSWVRFGSLVTEVGPSAFTSSTSLLQAEAASSVLAVRANAFQNCSVLGSITMLGVQIVETSAFAGCIALTSVNFPAVTTIGELAFQSCTALSIVNCSTATEVGNNAFDGCTSLLEANVSAASVVGSNAFLNCTALTDVYMNSATVVPDYCCSGCTSLSNAQFGTLDTIGEYAFNGCIALNSLDFSGTSTISSAAFANSGISGQFMIGASSIGAEAFANCTGISSVTLTNSTSIGNEAFSGCNALQSLYFVGDAPTLGIDAFNNIHASAIVYHQAGAAGYGASFGGIPTAVWTSYPDPM